MAFVTAPGIYSDLKKGDVYNFKQRMSFFPKVIFKSIWDDKLSTVKDVVDNMTTYLDGFGPSKLNRQYKNLGLLFKGLGNALDATAQFSKKASRAMHKLEELKDIGCNSSSLRVTTTDPYSQRTLADQQFYYENLLPRTLFR